MATVVKIAKSYVAGFFLTGRILRQSPYMVERPLVLSHQHSLTFRDGNMRTLSIPIVMHVDPVILLHDCPQVPGN